MAVVVGFSDQCGADLHDAPQSRHAHERIGDQPAGNTRKCPGDAELEKRRRNERMKQQADANQNWWMNDVHRIGSPVEPRP